MVRGFVQFRRSLWGAAGQMTIAQQLNRNVGVPVEAHLTGRQQSESPMHRALFAAPPAATRFATLPAP
jgi:hypothetical protein